MHNIALFGESQKGKYNTAYYCKSLEQLSDFLGEPPTRECRGLHYAIQALMYQRGVIFFRVREEGYSVEDYHFGLNFLENKEIIPKVSALCLPGVGNGEILETTAPICSLYKSILIINEQDFYDYLTHR